jgi:hypothetical protein
MSCTNASNMCSTCEMGFQVGESGNCLLCNITECITCVSDNLCMQCQLQYTTYNGSCFLCNLGNCSSCNATNVCETCAEGFTLTNGSCIIPCDVYNC